MSHAVETMFSVRETPWHKLGKVIPEYVGALEALQTAGLDWKVRLEPVQVTNPEWRTSQDVPGRAVVRDSDMKVLGCVGVRYTAVQNESLFAIGESIVGAGAKWETAGSLHGGRQVWALLAFGGEQEVVPGDSIKDYLLLSNDHSGYRSAECYLTRVRTVCANTFAMGIRQAGDLGFRFRHTSTVEERLRAAGEVLTVALKQRDKVTEVMQGMAKVRFTTDEQLRFVLQHLELDENLARHKRKVEVAKFALEWERQHAAPGVEQSLWTAFNAVTHYVSHADTAVRGGSDESRMQGLVHGALKKRATEAWTTARTLVADVVG